MNNIVSLKHTIPIFSQGILSKANSYTVKALTHSCWEAYFWKTSLRESLTYARASGAYMISKLSLNFYFHT